MKYIYNITTYNITMSGKQTKQMKNNKNNENETKYNNEGDVIKTLEKMLMEKFSEKEEKHKQLFKDQEAIVAKLINDNNQIINQRLDSMTKDIDELKESLQCTQSKIEEKEKSFRRIEEKALNVEILNKNLKTEVQALEKMKEKLIDLENRSRRNNLRIDGIKENAKESWNEWEMKIQKLLKKKLHMHEKIEIEQAHRSGNDDETAKNHGLSC